MQSISVCWGLEGSAFLECISAKMQIFSAKSILTVSVKSTVLLPKVWIILPSTATDEVWQTIACVYLDCYGVL